MGVYFEWFWVKWCVNLGAFLYDVLTSVDRVVIYVEFPKWNFGEGCVVYICAIASCGRFARYVYNWQELRRRGVSFTFHACNYRIICTFEFRMCTRTRSRIRFPENFHENRRNSPRKHCTINCRAVAFSLSALTCAHFARAGVYEDSGELSTNRKSWLGHAPRSFSQWAACACSETETHRYTEERQPRSYKCHPRDRSAMSVARFRGWRADARRRQRAFFQPLPVSNWKTTTVDW